MPIGFGHGQAVDEGGGHVHEQDGEGQAVGVAAPAADDEGEDGDAGAEDEFAARAGAAADRVGGDEEGAEHERAGKQVLYRRQVGAGGDQPQGGGVAKARPSGEGAERRMTRVRMRTPAPRVRWPRGLARPLTGSVAMKTAPGMGAPLWRCAPGARLSPEAISHRGVAMTSVVTTT